MCLEEVINLMRAKPYLIRMGRGKLSKRFATTPDIIKLARARVRNVNMPKILIFDIETAPMRAYVWNRWKQNISLELTISESYIICWSAKWLYSNEMMGDVLTPKEALEEDDFRICDHLYKVINEADIVVAHNGDSADIPWMNSRFIIHGFPPTKPYYSIDTLKIAKKQFGFSSNKLDALATYFGFPKKIETDFNLWVGCLKGNPVSLIKMFKYNQRDVQILEEVYLKLRPWQKGHPNIANFLDSPDIVCTNCGSSNYEEIPGEYYYTSIGKYKLYRCIDCGAVFRGRFSVDDKVKIIVNSIGK